MQEKFSFECADIEQIRGWALSDMGNKLKSWRYELKKKFYDESLTIDEIVASQNDARVDKEQFKELVTHWFAEKTQVHDTSLNCKKILMYLVIRFQAIANIDIDRWKVRQRRPFVQSRMSHM